jgi:hypothetical protein
MVATGPAERERNDLKLGMRHDDGGSGGNCALQVNLQVTLQVVNGVEGIGNRRDDTSLVGQ